MCDASHPAQSSVSCIRNQVRTGQRSSVVATTTLRKMFVNTKSLQLSIDSQRDFGLVSLNSVFLLLSIRCHVVVIVIIPCVSFIPNQSVRIWQNIFFVLVLYFCTGIDWDVIGHSIDNVNVADCETCPPLPPRRRIVPSRSSAYGTSLHASRRRGTWVCDRILYIFLSFCPRKNSMHKHTLLTYWYRMGIGFGPKLFGRHDEYVVHRCMAAVAAACSTTR